MSSHDDDWLETAVPGASTDPLVDQEWSRLSQKYNDAGYREGITDGKLATLQQGFDEGFKNSVNLSRAIGRLRGRATALLAWLTAPMPGAKSTPRGSPSASPAPSRGTTPPRDAVKDKLVEDVRQILRDLGKVRRDDVLPDDLERIAHEEEDRKAREEDGFQLESNDKRDMEGLEAAMEGFTSGASGGNGNHTDVVTLEKGEEFVRSFEDRLAALEARALRG